MKIKTKTKKKVVVALGLLVLSALLVLPINVKAENNAGSGTHLNSYYEEDLHLTIDGSPYETEAGNGLYLSAGHTLTIDPGVTLRLGNGSLYLDNSDLKVGDGNENENENQKVILESLSDVGNFQGIYLDHSNAYIKDLEIRGAVSPIYLDQSTVVLNGVDIDATKNPNSYTGIYVNGGTFSMSTSSIRNFSNVGIFVNDTSGFINSSLISGNGKGVFYDGSSKNEFSGHENIFDNKEFEIYNNNQLTTLDFTLNDWGNINGPKPEKIVGNVLTGFEDDALPCCSNVVFLPGLESTRLVLGNNQLWEPNRNADVEKLYLDGNGKSINDGIETDGIIGTTNVLDPFPVFRKKIYQSFIDDMDNLVLNQKIKSWKAFPYDWRLDIKDVVTDEMVNEVINMAQNSYNEKVSIIGHSNGGLIGKILINRLQEMGKGDIVDKFIMVAVPQLGTPSAIAGILHGDGQEIPENLGFLLNKSTARKMGENMPSTYTLLPSPDYFDVVSDPVVIFDQSIDKIFNHDQLGDSIDSYGEQFQFMTTGIIPSFYDTDTPNVLSQNLMGMGANTQQMLNAWKAPPNTKVTEIAGWGLDTISGIEYSAKRKFLCIGEGSDCFTWDHKPIFTEDGDGTVVIPSALGSALGGALTSGLVSTDEKYYVNLNKNNEDQKKNYNHADILEVDPVRQFIQDKIISSSSLPNYFSLEKPANNQITKTLRFDIHSPVTLGITDEYGNYTGILEETNSEMTQIREDIPNSYYMDFGEGKYAGVSGNGNYQVNLKGTGSGTFTLKIEESDGNSGTVKSFVDIPVATSTVTILPSVDDISNLTLKVDMEGDGIFEKEIKPEEDEEEKIEKDPIEYLESLKTRIITLHLPQKWENTFTKKIDNIIKSMKKDKKTKVAKAIGKYLERIDRKITKIQQRKNKKNLPDVEDLRDIENELSSIGI